MSGHVLYVNFWPQRQSFWLFVPKRRHCYLLIYSGHILGTLHCGNKTTALVSMIVLAPGHYSLKAGWYHTLLGVVAGQRLWVHMWEGDLTLPETETKNRKRKTCAHVLQTVLGETAGGRRNPHCSLKVFEVFLALPELETRLTRKPWTQRHLPTGRNRALCCVFSDNGTKGKVATETPGVPAKTL